MPIFLLDCELKNRFTVNGKTTLDLLKTTTPKIVIQSAQNTCCHWFLDVLPATSYQQQSPFTVKWPTIDCMQPSQFFFRRHRTFFGF